MIRGYVFDVGDGKRRLIYADSRLVAEEILAAELDHRKFMFMGDVLYGCDDNILIKKQQPPEVQE